MPELPATSPRKHEHLSGGPLPSRAISQEECRPQLTGRPLLTVTPFTTWDMASFHGDQPRFLPCWAPPALSLSPPGWPPLPKARRLRADSATNLSWLDSGPGVRARPDGAIGHTLATFSQKQECHLTYNLTGLVSRWPTHTWLFCLFFVLWHLGAEIGLTQHFPSYWALVPGQGECVLLDPIASHTAVPPLQWPAVPCVWCVPLESTHVAADMSHCLACESFKFMEMIWCCKYSLTALFYYFEVLKFRTVLSSC